MTITLADEAAKAGGRQWTDSDYAQRDAVLGALGIKAFRRPTKKR